MRPRGVLALVVLGAAVALVAWMAAGSLRERGPIVPLELALVIEDPLGDSAVIERDAKVSLELDRGTGATRSDPGFGVIDAPGARPERHAGALGTLSIPAHASRRFTLRADGPDWAQTLAHGFDGATLRIEVAAHADTARLAGTGALRLSADSLAHAEIHITLARPVGR